LTGISSHADTNAAAPIVMSDKAVAGEAVYQAACLVCHGSGLAGAPKTGDVAVWAERMTKGIDVLISHALYGYNGDAGVMPAKGGRMDLSDEQVTNAVHFMVESLPH
jgi:cytochrome c